MPSQTFALNGRPAWKAIRSDSDTFQSLRICAGQYNREAGHGTNNNRVDKRAGHGNQTLTNRFVGLCCSCRNRRTAEAGLIREDAAGNALLHSKDNSAQRAACHCTHAKCTLNNQNKGCRNLCHIHNQQQHAECNINTCHKRYDNLRYACNALNTADDNQCNAHSDNNCRNQYGIRIVFSEQLECPCIVAVKEVVDSRGNTIYLCNGTDAPEYQHRHQRMQTALLAISTACPCRFRYNRMGRPVHDLSHPARDT